MGLRAWSTLVKLVSLACLAAMLVTVWQDNILWIYGTIALSFCVVLFALLLFERG